MEVLKIRSVLFVVVVEDVFAFPDVAVVVISTNENKNHFEIYVMKYSKNLYNQ